uniref:Tripartite motif containing 65 n=1 Tax=Catharus ustulatus TaxID=91951 RepID=A0A8C3U9Z2_CATUS
MAAAALEEKLVCCICLELFRVPVTLPCGHNFCKRCISDHWHKQKQEPSGTAATYTCPECRRGFERCPELEKNVILDSVVELARDSEARGSGTGRCAVAPGELCRQHGRPLELYCEDERRCICCICTVRDCQRHRRVLFEEERAKKQVASLCWPVGGSTLVLMALPAQDCSELEAGIQSKFTHLRTALEDLQRQTMARIEQEKVAALERVDKNWNLCKDRLDVLSQHRERAQSLLACSDHRTFLQVPCTLLMAAESCSTHSHWECILTLAQGCDGAMGKTWFWGSLISAPSMPLLSPDHRNLTFDPDTANKYLELSKGARKAKHGASAVPGQEQGPRFQPWQVLCTQSFGPGRHYWEVKISSHSVILGVTYRGLPREQQRHRFNIGLDGGSWGLQVLEDCYLAWHKGQAEKIQEQLYKNLGVSLDYGKGLLSFYGLGERTKLIHSFHSVFTEPLYPVFWLCEGRVVTLCQRD